METGRVPAQMYSDSNGFIYGHKIKEGAQEMLSKLLMNKFKMNQTKI